MHINDLPPELLVLIFSKIDDFSQKIRLELVCRHWRQNVFLNWKTTKTCLNPLDNQETFRHVLNRCGEWLEELWLQYAKFTEKSINRIKQMKCLKHLKLSKCQLDDASVDSIAELFGQQLCSFILDETPYHTKMRRMIENNSSKLEHLQIYLNRNYSARTLPSKLPTNLKSFSLHTSSNEIRSLLLIRRVAKNCKNLKILHLEMHTLWPDIIWAIGNIKSLIYLNLDVNFIANAFVLKNVICNELPNLKAIKIGGYCYEETVLDICQARPDLLYFNVYTDITQQDFQISESLNSLAIHSKTTDENFRLLLLKILLFQKNKSIQHLDIRSFILPSPNYLLKLLGLFPDLKSIHCKLSSIFTDLTIFFYIIEKNLENGRNFTIYFHFGNQQNCKYSLPDDFRQFNIGWRANISNGKCENLVLRKVIKKAIDGRNNPSFLDDLWME